MTKRKKQEKLEIGLEALKDLFGDRAQTVLDSYEEGEAREGFLEKLADAQLRQSDYSRAMDEVRAKEEEAEKKKSEVETWYTQLNTWHTGEQDRIKALESESAELQRLRSSGTFDDGDGEGGTPQPPQPSIDTSKFATREDIQRLQGGLVDQGVTLYSALHGYNRSHFEEFGELLDMEALQAHVRKVGKPIDQGGYDSFVAERRKEAADADRKTAIEEAEKRGEERALSRINSEPPYPTSGAPAFGGTLAGLDKAAGAENRGVAAAVRNVMDRRQRASK